MASPKEKNDSSDLPGDIWLMRPCEIYLEEFSDCASLRGRFHQYYTLGTYGDCDRWQQDYKNCLKFRNTGDIEALSIIAHEKERREARLRGARGNDVWEYRKSPPKDWNADLTEWSKEKQNTILAKAQETNEKAGTISHDSGSRCVVS